MTRHLAACRRGYVHLWNDPARANASRRLLPQVKLEPRRRHAELAEGPRLELADSLAGDAEAVADLFERLRLFAVEAEAQGEHVPHTWIQAGERSRHLARAQPLGGRLVRLRRVHVLDQVAVEALAVADRRLEAHRVVDQLEQVADLRRRQPRLVGELQLRRLAVQLLCEL